MSSDRTYTSAGSSYRPSLFGEFRFFPPVIKSLLIANVTAWLFLDVLLRSVAIGGVQVFRMLEEAMMLWPISSGQFLPWQVGTYMFLHGGFLHLFFNMLVLWLFGTELEHLWGSKKFLFYYLTCGVGGALANLFIAPLFGSVGPTVGASGAIFGILIAFGFLFPDRPIYLYFLLPIRAKYFVAGYIAFELILGVTQTEDHFAHFAHLGGAAVGFLLLMKDMSFFRSGGAFWRGGSATRRSTGSARGGWSDRERDVREARFYDISTGKPMRDEDESENPQEVIDAILDKISRGGYQSLTDEEKRILNEASKKIN